jgi:CBS domain-containing protein
MICPTCLHDNVPGIDECEKCGQNLTQLDQPAPRDRIERCLMEERVRSLHPRTPVTIRPTTTVQDAMQAMLDNDLGALIVVDKDGKLLGIFSERDVLKKIAGIHEQYAELPVAQFMTPNPETVSEDDVLAFALHKMDIGSYRHLPVAGDGQPTGMISVRDMLRYITRQCREN